MSTYFLINKETLRRIENIAHGLKEYNYSLEINEYANEIILLCNEPTQYNTKQETEK